MYDGDLKHQAHENFDNPKISDLYEFINKQKKDKTTEEKPNGKETNKKNG